MHINGISDEDWVATMQRQDEKLRAIIEQLDEEPTTSAHRQLRTDYETKKGRLFRKCAEVLRWVVPVRVVWRVLMNAHDDDGHFGLDKTLARVQLVFWFPRMRQSVRNYIAVSQTEGRRTRRPYALP